MVWVLLCLSFFCVKVLRCICKMLLVLSAYNYTTVPVTAPPAPHPVYVLHSLL